MKVLDGLAIDFSSALGTNYNNIKACSIVMKPKAIPELRNCRFSYRITFKGIRYMILYEYKAYLGDGACWFN